jgi:hypothetical protein
MSFLPVFLPCIMSELTSRSTMGHCAFRNRFAAYLTQEHSCLFLSKTVRTKAVLRSRSREAEIKLPPGAGAEITNCGSSSFLFFKDLKKLY